jgi:predicted nucleic acid-binding protein
MSVLLDSTFVIDCLRGHAIARRLFSELDVKPSVSVITVAEILAGVRKRQEEDDAAIFWAATSVLPVNHEIAQRAGGFVRHYRASHSVELSDALIAATAEHHELKLATLNTKHFPMFPKLKRAY